MPIDNGAFNPDRTNGIVDVGNRAGDISSDDIESINVLKGAAATALYGARAKDGAIVITTKKVVAIRRYLLQLILPHVLRMF